MEKIKVFLADWQVLFREGIHFILSGEEDFEVIGESTSGEEALNFIENNPPKVAIFNVDRGKPSGVEIARRIKQNLPSVSIILIMDRYNDEQLFAAIKSGASACLTKDMEPDELLHNIRKVAQGDHPISQALLTPEIASRVVDEFEAFSTIDEEMGNVLAHLLPAEDEILHHIASGSLLEEIGKVLGVNEESIRQHLDVILNKLVTNERSRALIETVQSNLTSALSRVKGGGRPAADYVTREEFLAFKEDLRERFRSLTGELGVKD